MSTTKTVKSERHKKQIIKRAVEVAEFIDRHGSTNFMALVIASMSDGQKDYATGKDISDMLIAISVKRGGR